MTQLQLPKIRLKVLGDQLEQHLRTMPGPPPVTVYRGEVAGTPPVMVTDGVPDPSGRVAPYVVLFDGTGARDHEPALDPTCAEELRWTPQITVAAGFTEDCTQTLDRVLAWIRPWRPVIDEVASGMLTFPPGYDPGPARPDRSVTPIRFFVPVLLRLDLTT